MSKKYIKVPRTQASLRDRIAATIYQHTNCQCKKWSSDNHLPDTIVVELLGDS